MQASISIITKSTINKLFFIFLLSMLTGSTVFSQIYNHGEIHMDEGAELYIDGDYENHPGAFIANRGSLFLKGNLVNFSNESIFHEEKGKVVLSGAFQEIIGNDPLFGELHFEDDQSLVLNTFLSVDKLLQLSNGELNLHGETLILQNMDASSLIWDQGYILSDESASRVKWVAPVEQSEYEVPFSTDNAQYVPLFFEILSTSIGAVELNTYAVDDNNQPLPEGITHMEYDGQNVAEKTIDRFWFIDPAGESINIGFSFSENDQQGNELGDVENLMLLYHDGNNWTLSGEVVRIDDRYYQSAVSQKGWYALAALTTPVKELNTGDMILSPVPSSEKIYLSLPEMIGKNVQITIIVMDGKKVMDEKIVDTESTIPIDLSSILPGNYLLILKDLENNNLYKQKFIRY